MLSTMAVCPTSSLHSFPSRFASTELRNPIKLESQPLLLLPIMSSSLLPSKAPFHLTANNKFNRTHLHNHHNNNRTVFKFRASASSPGSGSGANVILLTSSVITVTLAVANRVLYKLALVPMNNYPFFLAQFITFG